MPNTVIKRLKGDYVVPESIIIKDNVYLDIDYTDHGNPKTYPYMPRILRWTKKQMENSIMVIGRSLYEQRRIRTVD